MPQALQENKSERIRQYAKSNKGLKVRQIVEGLTAEGLKVSTDLVRKALSVGRTKNARKSKRTNHANATKAARKKQFQGNMSESIRQYAQAHPSQKPAEIVAGLKGLGVVVSYALVASVLTRVRGKSQKRKNKKRKELRGRELNFAGLQSGVQFVREHGGNFETARKVLDLLEELRG